MKLQFENTKYCRRCGMTFHKKIYSKQIKSNKRLLNTREKVQLELCTIKYKTTEYEEHVNT